MASSSEKEVIVFRGENGGLTSSGCLTSRLCWHKTKGIVAPSSLAGGAIEHISSASFLQPGIMEWLLRLALKYKVP